MNLLNPAFPATLIIIGMHRSGTSLTASQLQSAGLNIGDRLVNGSIGNIKGHFENLDFHCFHRSILKAHAIHPDGWTLQKNIDIEPIYIETARTLIQNNTRSPVWGWKDPRTSLFLNFWAELLPEAYYLMVYRAPWEVVDSLYRRGNDETICQQPDLAPKIWHHYNKLILDFYNTYPDRCFLINLQTSLSHSQEWITALNQKFKLSLSNLDPKLYEPTLLHNQSSLNPYSNLLHRYFPETITLYQKLEENSWRPEEVNIDISWQAQLNPRNLRACIFQTWFQLRAQDKSSPLLETELKQT